jgi:hypothetical protein
MSKVSISEINFSSGLVAICFNIIIGGAVKFTLLLFTFPNLTPYFVY